MFEISVQVLGSKKRRWWPTLSIRIRPVLPVGLLGSDSLGAAVRVNAAREMSDRRFLINILNILFEFSSVQVDGFDGAGVGDVFERVLAEDYEVRDFAFGQSAEILIDPERFGVCFGESLYYLHGHHAAVLHHEFHFKVLEEALIAGRPVSAVAA